MKNNLRALLSIFLMGAACLSIQGQGSSQKTLVVTMTNDPVSNALVVVDAATHERLQTISTNGKGGVSGNARGVAQYDSRLFAAVNYGSRTVSLFQRAGDRLIFENSVVTTSSPVSVNFSNGHMYVAGSSTVDSFIMNGSHVGYLDGTTRLVLAEGGFPEEGSTAQVEATDEDTLLVTLKTDPSPGTVDVVPLRKGAVAGDVTPVAGPAGTLAPFGFSVYPDGTALITLAHSGHNALFREGAFTFLVSSVGQAGNCWTTLIGKYAFIVNTGSRTISRLVGTGSNLFVDSVVAATIGTGAPTDTDAAAGFLGVIDHSGGIGATSHLTLFTYNEFGELTASGSAIDLGVPDANGVAIMQGLRP